MLLPPFWNFALKPMIGRLAMHGFHKRAISFVGHLGLVHMERIDISLSNGRVVFERIWVPGEASIRPVIASSARKLAARNENHSGLSSDASRAEQAGGMEEQNCNRRCCRLLRSCGLLSSPVLGKNWTVARSSTC